MDELEAVNMLLRLVGSSPVNTLETAHPDVANARVTLNRILKRVQKIGWWFNTDYNHMYTPDINKLIILPDEILSVITESAGIVMRGKKLYNRYDQTYLFDCPVNVVKEIRKVEWDEAPGSFQEYCAYFAAGEFIRDELEDLNKKTDIEKDAARALIEVKREDLRSATVNVFNSRRILNARAGVQPYHRNNRRFFGDPDV